MFVGDLSLKAECGSHTPWHALARPGTCKCRNLWFPRVSCRAWIGFGACTFLHVVSSCHEVIPGGTKATIVSVDEDGDLPVFTDDGKTMVTCSMWLQVRERQCGPRIPTSPTLQLQKSDVQTTSNLTTHLQSLPMCCCRSVGYFLGALVEVLHSESVVNM